MAAFGAFIDAILQAFLQPIKLVGEHFVVQEKRHLFQPSERSIAIGVAIDPGNAGDAVMFGNNDRRSHRSAHLSLGPVVQATSALRVPRVQGETRCRI